MRGSGKNDKRSLKDRIVPPLMLLGSLLILIIVYGNLHGCRL